MMQVKINILYYVFIRVNAVSGATNIGGIDQFPNPPINTIQPFERPVNTAKSILCSRLSNRNYYGKF